jgi:hypothetical protein
MHQRLANEFVLRLARRALAIIAPCLREEEWRDAFQEFHEAFKEELIRYEVERDRMNLRLTGATTDGRTEPGHAGQEAGVQGSGQHGGSEEISS